MPRTIIITESMANEISDSVITEAFKVRRPLNGNAVLAVASFLDSHFRRDMITDIDSDGRIIDVYVGNRMDSHGQVVDQKKLEEIVGMLEDEKPLRNLISDSRARKKFFTIVVRAWYAKLIDKHTGIIRGMNDYEV